MLTLQRVLGSMSCYDCHICSVGCGGVVDTKQLESIAAPDLQSDSLLSVVLSDSTTGSSSNGKIGHGHW